ncbi:hypothetical protein EVAR_102672_1 [Eumeta japonica]|uniref:Uncharacterized protein n=1 Tax=Eumeta variegata TaxID=151549 RepID=A0A4C1TUU7_EUMVA|nr:hypothetical protein EVAR_102672_1 [Eumeta japonica]
MVRHALDRFFFYLSEICVRSQSALLRHLKSSVSIITRIICVNLCGKSKFLALFETYRYETIRRIMSMNMRLRRWLGSHAETENSECESHPVIYLKAN